MSKDVFSQPRRAFLGTSATVLSGAVLGGRVMATPAAPSAQVGSVKMPAVIGYPNEKGVTIERVDELPTVPVQSGLGTFLGDPVTLEQARERVSFDVVVPDALGTPDEVYFQDGPPAGGMVSFVYGTSDDPHALGLEVGSLPGGRYARERLTGEPPKIYEPIGPTFERLATRTDRDPSRPGIEFYRRRDVIDLLLPIV